MSGRTSFIFGGSMRFAVGGSILAGGGVTRLTAGGADRFMFNGVGGILLGGRVSDGEGVAACGELVEAVISCTSRSSVCETIIPDKGFFAGAGSFFESGVRSSV